MGPIQPVQIEKNIFSKMTEKNLERLRNESSFGKIGSEKGIEKVSRDFESVFLHKLLTAMRKTVPKSGLLDSFASDMYQSMMDEEIAKEMSTKKGMGMGEMIYNELNNINRVRRGQSIQSTYTELKTDTAVLGNELKDKILGRKLQNSKISGMKLKE